MLWQGWRPHLIPSCLLTSPGTSRLLSNCLIFLSEALQCDLSNEPSCRSVKRDILTSYCFFFSLFTSFTFSDRQRFFLITNYSQEVTNTAAVTDSLICSLDCSSIIQFSVFYRIFVINTSVNPLMCGREKGSKHIFVFSFCFTEKRSSPNKLLIICHWHGIV